MPFAAPIYLSLIAAALVAGRTAGIPVMTVTAVDFALIAPDSVPAGPLTIRLQNDGMVPHHAWLVRLEAGRTLRDLERVLVTAGRLPPWAVDAGGVGAVVPGREARATVVLEPGRHVLFSAELLPDGGRAVMRGMYRQLDVSSRRSASRPTDRTSVSIEIDGDRTAIVGGPLRPGTQRVLVRNAGAVSYELRLYQPRAGTRPPVEALLSWLRAQPGPAPADVIGGVTGLPPGGSAVIELSLTRGDYLLAHRPSPLRGVSAPPGAFVVPVR